MPKIKNIIIFIAIAAVFVLIYVFYVKQSPPTEPLVSSLSSSTTGGSTALVDDSSVAADFLTLLLNVRNIKLNDAIFSDTAFGTLHDSSITLVPDATTGRPNPFAQFGADIVVPPTTPAQTITTPPAGAPASPKP